MLVSVQRYKTQKIKMVFFRSDIDKKFFSEWNFHSKGDVKHRFAQNFSLPNLYNYRTFSIVGRIGKKSTWFMIKLHRASYIVKLFTSGGWDNIPSVEFLFCINPLHNKFLQLLK